MTASPKLTVTFKTAPVGGEWTPANVVAVWIEGPPAANQTIGPFIKTIGRWADARRDHLIAWVAAAGPADVDAVSGATRQDHSGSLTATWDLKDKLGNLVPDGTYTVRIELSDSNATTSGQNDQGTFTFIKGLQPQMQTGLTGGSVVPFTEVSIDYDPTAGECNNNVVDPGETCDPPGSCPVACDTPADACSSAVLSGSAATCNALCTVTTITACVNGDGCCAEGCTPENDSDCEDHLGGGCSTGDAGAGAPLLALGALGVALTLGRRVRRRAA